MNGKNLMIGLSYIDRKLIEESEMEIPKRRQRPKLWLVAAVIAMTLLLVGCAVVVYARIQMKLVQHYVPEETIAAVMQEETTEPVKNILTDCYPQRLPEGYQIFEGAPVDRVTRRISFRKDDGQILSFFLSVGGQISGSLHSSETEIVQVSGREAILEHDEEYQLLNWNNEGCNLWLVTSDMTLDLPAVAESVDFGKPLPLNFLCKNGEVWDVWYPQQIPESFACTDVSPVQGGQQGIRYGCEEKETTIEYQVSPYESFDDISDPPHDTFVWNDVTVAEEPARMLTTSGGLRLLFWENKQEGFYAMLSVRDDAVDIFAMAESVAPGAPLAVSDYYLGPDYTIEMQQNTRDYVGWESIYPQKVPEGFNITFVEDPAYGQQIIIWQNEAKDGLEFTQYFRLSDWGIQFDGMGQPEPVTVGGNPGYRSGNVLLWTDEAKGLGFCLRSNVELDLLEIAESVGPGPELEPTNSDKTRQALEQLGDYRPAALPAGMTEDSTIGWPKESADDWYSYVRRWYIDKQTNREVFFTYETYITADDSEISTPEETVQMFIGDRPAEYRTINGCTGAIVSDDSGAEVAWLVGDGNKGVCFMLISEDYSAQELLAMAESVQKQ